MWKNHQSRVMGIHLGHQAPNFFWWYRLFICGRLCPICFSKELCFGGSIFVFKVLYFH
jgi:hypothetical protein